MQKPWCSQLVEQVNFSYREDNENKAALVKLRVCRLHASKLGSKFQKLDQEERSTDGDEHSDEDDDDDADYERDRRRKHRDSETSGPCNDEVSRYFASPPPSSLTAYEFQRKKD